MNEVIGAGIFVCCMIPYILYVTNMWVDIAANFATGNAYLQRNKLLGIIS